VQLRIRLGEFLQVTFHQNKGVASVVVRVRLPLEEIGACGLLDMALEEGLGTGKLQMADIGYFLQHNDAVDLVGGVLGL
jgi:hypothetical protein